MFPRIFEAIVFLKMNIDFWASQAGNIIHEMEAKRWDDRLGVQYNSDDESDIRDDF